MDSSNYNRPTDNPALRTPSAEYALYDYAERLEKHRRGRVAIHIHLSKLQAHNRREHHIRIATNTFESLVKYFDGQLFVLKNNDIIFVARDVPVEKIDDGIRRLARDMAETMYEAPGIGLAATQVDVHLRVIVIDSSETRDQLLVLINPELEESEGVQVCEEGCLSVPGIFDKVERAERVVVRYLDVQSKRQTVAAEGLLAVCLQHEMDHLEGRVFVEHLSLLKQTRIKAKLAKQSRITA